MKFIVLPGLFVKISRGIFYKGNNGAGHFIAKRFFVRLVIFLLFIVTGASCNSGNSPVADNIIYYYPEKNVYYDSLQSYYYYSLDSAKTWDSMAFKGPDYGRLLGPKIAIEKTSNKMWLYNESHRKAFKGVLLNIINNRTILLSVTDSVKKIKPVIAVKTAPVKTVEKEEPPKKGLKRFFSRLFGKKKKPAEEKKQ